MSYTTTLLGSHTSLSLILCSVHATLLLCIALLGINVAVKHGASASVVINVVNLRRTRLIPGMNDRSLVRVVFAPFILFYFILFVCLKTLEHIEKYKIKSKLKVVSNTTAITRLNSAWPFLRGRQYENSQTWRFTRRIRYHVSIVSQCNYLLLVDDYENQSRSMHGNGNSMGIPYG